MSISVPLWLLFLIGIGLYCYAYKQACFRWKCKLAMGKIHIISNDTRGRLFDMQGLDATTKKYLMDEWQWENVFDWERPPMNAPRPDLPHGLYDFIRRFPDDDACWRYLVQSRWPDGFRSPDGAVGSFIKTRKLFQCRNGHQWSATAGTVMHRTKIPLCKWFWGPYLVGRG